MSLLSQDETMLPWATENALVLPEGLAEDEWEEVGQKLGRAHRASGWWIGDWINYGEDAGYVSRARYERAERLTGLKRSTLWTYAYTARRYDGKSLIRIKDWTFSAHRLALLVKNDEPFEPFEIRTDRDRQWADAAARKTHQALAGITGYCDGLTEVDFPRAIAGANAEDIAAWEGAARDAAARLNKFKRALKEARDA